MGKNAREKSGNTRDNQKTRVGKWWGCENDFKRENRNEQGEKEEIGARKRKTLERKFGHVWGNGKGFRKKTNVTSNSGGLSW